MNRLKAVWIDQNRSKEHSGAWNRLKTPETAWGKNFQKKMKKGQSNPRNQVGVSIDSFIHHITMKASTNTTAVWWNHYFQKSLDVIALSCPSATLKVSSSLPLRIKIPVIQSIIYLLFHMEVNLLIGRCLWVEWHDVQAIHLRHLIQDFQREAQFGCASSQRRITRSRHGFQSIPNIITK